MMDARNHNLQRLTALEAAAMSEPMNQAAATALAQVRWLLGRTAWFAEAWLGRNTQRMMGAQCPPQPVRTASVAPWSDMIWGGEFTEGPATGVAADADTDDLRAYLLETLEITLELLQKVPESDDALYFFRLALMHEDMTGERLLVLAQTHGVRLSVELPPTAAPRAPIGLPTTRWELGSVPGGFVFDNEKWAHEVRVPEFEIDAQTVSWAQFVEFVDDGGYDNADCWHPQGWAWLQAQDGRCGPRHVEHIGVARAGAGGAVMQLRFGQPVRMAGHHPVTHASWWEADAWCRWAGRRLPDEVEWEMAAQSAGRRGFAWGEVHEWTASRFQPYPGFRADPWAAYSAPHFGQCRVMRGGSWATSQRLKHPKYRGFGLPELDEPFVGFRSCAI